MARHWPARWTTAPVAVAGSIDDHCRYLTALRAAPGQAFSDPVCRSGTTIHRSQLLTTNQCGPGHRSGVSDARRRRLVGPENRRTPVACRGLSRLLLSFAFSVSFLWWSNAWRASKETEANREQHWLFGGPAQRSSPRVPAGSDWHTHT